MKPIIILTGPTAAGKTALATMLADEFPVSLINADSQQVYRGMDIGTAKLPPNELANYPHALIDIRAPEQAYSVSEFVADASAAIKKAHQANRWPLLVGGTPLYLRAILYGLDPLPSADPEVRGRLQQEASQKGWDNLHARLKRIDPELSRKIRVTDPQRIQRALEIHELTGRPPSSLMTHNRRPLYRSHRLVVTPKDRNILHQRITQRFDIMLQQGFLDEMHQLMSRPGLSASDSAMKSVGYRQAWAYVENAQSNIDDLRASVTAATRQLAKRQLTALRKLSRALWYDSECGRASEQIRHSVVKFTESERGDMGCPSIGT